MSRSVIPCCLVYSFHSTRNVCAVDGGLASTASNLSILVREVRMFHVWEDGKQFCLSAHKARRSHHGSLCRVRHSMFCMAFSGTLLCVMFSANASSPSSLLGHCWSLKPLDWSLEPWRCTKLPIPSRAHMYSLPCCSRGCWRSLGLSGVSCWLVVGAVSHHCGTPVSVTPSRTCTLAPLRQSLHVGERYALENPNDTVVLDREE